MQMLDAAETVPLRVFELAHTDAGTGTSVARWTTLAPSPDKRLTLRLTGSNLRSAQQ